MAAEDQSALDTVRQIEWQASLLCEALHADFNLEERELTIPQRVACMVTDCKSLYELLLSPTGTSSDREANFDA